MGAPVYLLYLGKAVNNIHTYKCANMQMCKCAGEITLMNEELKGALVYLLYLGKAGKITKLKELKE